MMHGVLFKNSRSFRCRFMHHTNGCSLYFGILSPVGWTLNAAPRYKRMSRLAYQINEPKRVPLAVCLNLTVLATTIVRSTLCTWISFPKVFIFLELVQKFNLFIASRIGIPCYGYQDAKVVAGYQHRFVKACFRYVPRHKVLETTSALVTSLCRMDV